MLLACIHRVIVCYCIADACSVSVCSLAMHQFRRLCQAHVQNAQFERCVCLPLQLCIGVLCLHRHHLLQHVNLHNVARAKQACSCLVQTLVCLCKDLSDFHASLLHWGMLKAGGLHSAQFSIRPSLHSTWQLQAYPFVLHNAQLHHSSELLSRSVVGACPNRHNFCVMSGY